MKKTLLCVNLLFAGSAWALSVSEPVMLSQPEFKNYKPKVAVNEEGEKKLTKIAIESRYAGNRLKWLA